MYIIQEMQTTGNQTNLLPAITKTNRDEADSTFHSILASAAISSVNVHTVVMLDEHGNTVRREFYEHLPQEA